MYYPRRKTSPPLTIIFSWCLGAIFLAFGLSGIFCFFLEKQIHGTIFDLQQNNEIAIVFSYKNREYSSRQIVRSISNYKKGQRIPIYLKDNDPKKVKFGKSVCHRTGVLILNLGLTLLGILLVSLSSPKKNKKVK